MPRLRQILLIVLLAAVAAFGYAALRYPHVLFARAVPLEFTADERAELPGWSWVRYSRAYLAELREEFGLDAVAAGTETDLERLAAVTNWVNGLWRHDGGNQPSANDPLTILREAAAGGRFRCVEYSIVIAGCLEALGMDARVVGLKTADVETRSSGAGHVVAEAYLRDLGKWAMADGQWNVIPVLAGRPLNAVELQQTLADGQQGQLEMGGAAGWQAVVYRRWIVPYLHYFDTGVDGEYLMLGPVGAPQPRTFQGRMPLNVTIYTHSVREFYPAPE